MRYNHTVNELALKVLFLSFVKFDTCKKSFYKKMQIRFYCYILDKTPFLEKNAIACNWDYLWKCGMSFGADDSEIKTGQTHQAYILRLGFAQEMKWGKIGQEMKKR